ncbi:cupin domain-containing protein [Asaia spathodeae]|uniref:cupin domain-containing protein n=1 Tax=Asaia spathodeae TaxID=657016 RepID=UPI002FC3CC33
MKYLWPLPLLLAFLAAAAPTQAAEKPPEKPLRSYQHLWTDENGVSHIARCPVSNFFLKSMSPPAGPQWQNPMAPQTATLMMTVQPRHWNGAWHPDPKPQWIIPLKGRWWVRAMDGTRVEMGPGDILFGEDQDVHPMTEGPYKGKKGHDAGNVGDDEVTLLVIQSANPPEINKPCRYH